MFRKRESSSVIEENFSCNAEGSIRAVHYVVRLKRAAVTEMPEEDLTETHIRVRHTF